jgi:hypothetical protein
MSTGRHFDEHACGLIFRLREEQTSERVRALDALFDHRFGTGFRACENVIHWETYRRKGGRTILGEHRSRNAMDCAGCEILNETYLRLRNRVSSGPLPICPEKSIPESADLSSGFMGYLKKTASRLFARTGRSEQPMSIGEAECPRDNVTKKIGEHRDMLAFLERKACHIDPVLYAAVVSAVRSDVRSWRRLTCQSLEISESEFLSRWRLLKETLQTTSAASAWPY